MNSDRTTSRRQFMTAAFQKDGVEQTDHAQEQSDEPSCLLHIGRRAMACQFEVILNQQDRETATEAAVAALDLVDELESQLSVYRDQSELSQLNRCAASQAVSVERGLYGLLARSSELHQLTAGAFDITSTPLSKLWGFHRREGRLPSAEDVTSCLAMVGSQHLLLHEQSQSVQFLHPSLEVNVNGIGKGYTLDCCRRLLLDQGVADFLLQGGRSSVVAVGQRKGISESSPGWKVALRHPGRPDERIFEFDLLDAALGTSGSAAHSFYYRGQRYGHILDPRTGWPATGVLSATVLAPDAALADALSTAFYVMGAEAAMALCETRPELASILIVPGARAGSIEAHTIGIPVHHLRVCAKTSFPVVRHDRE